MHIHTYIHTNKQTNKLIKVITRFLKLKAKFDYAVFFHVNSFDMVSAQILKVYLNYIIKKD